MEIFFLVLACLVFAFLWWLDGLNKRFSEVESEIKQLRVQLSEAQHSDLPSSCGLHAALHTSPAYQSLVIPEQTLPLERESICVDETKTERFLQRNNPPETRPSIESKPNLDGPAMDLLDKIKEHWMVALGGFCVALAGIFLAKLAMEQGYFGPLPRILLGLLTGLGLHFSAEHFRRKTGESNSVFGALAGGGSITLFAVLLVAMNHYHMIPREIGFVLLFAVAMGTMLLAIVHGPALAAIGIVGAYIVPLFITTGGGEIPLALAYSVIVTTSGLFLLNHVFRVWLWNALFIGALAWWCFSLNTPDIAIAQGLYLPAIFYLFLAIPNQNWTLQQPHVLKYNTPVSFIFFPTHSHERDHILIRGLLAILGLQVLFWPFTDHLSTAIYAWAPLFLLTLLAARKRESFTIIPWTMVILELVGYLARLTSYEGNDALTRIVFSLGVILLAVVLGSLNLRRNKFKLSWSAFVTGVPLLMALSCFLSLKGIGDNIWAITFGVMTLVYGVVAVGAWRKNHAHPLLISSLFCGHFTASMAALVLTENATLTLVLALQMVSLAWIIKQFELKQAGWLFQLFTAIVLIRLTLNPLLLAYDSSTHWSLIAYGGSLACGLISMRLLVTYPKIRNWAEVAAILLLVLFLWSELRYWFNDGDIFSSSASLLERCLTMILFTGISIFYHRRSLFSEHLKTLYRTSSYGLLLGIVVTYLSLLWDLFSQGEWFISAIGSTPIFNMILLGFGLPILLSWLVSRFHDPIIATTTLGFGIIATFVFINLEIRHLWQASLDLSASMGSAELYTYSIVWLSIAILTTLTGALRRDEIGKQIYQLGMEILGLVILKIFLIDTANLDGLFRVLSFMGLGLSLLGLAYVHQLIKASKKIELS